MYMYMYMCTRTVLDSCTCIIIIIITVGLSPVNGTSSIVVCNWWSNNINGNGQELNTVSCKNVLQDTRDTMDTITSNRLDTLIAITL